MACRISELAVDCVDPESLAAFWCEVLGYQVVDREEGAVEIGPDGPGMTIFFAKHDEPKTGKLRWHIDVCATDRDQPAELERLLALGASRIDIGQGKPSWHVLADPEGNEFCLLSRRESP